MPDGSLGLEALINNKITFETHRSSETLQFFRRFIDSSGSWNVESISISSPTPHCNVELNS